MKTDVLGGPSVRPEEKDRKPPHRQGKELSLEGRLAGHDDIPRTGNRRGVCHCLEGQA